MKRSIFCSGIRPRLLAALSFAALVIALVNLLARPGVPDSAASATPAATGPAATTLDPDPVRLRVDIQSAQPVEVWIVRLGDVEINPTSDSAYSWQGDVFFLGEADSDLLSVLTFAPASARGSNALRIRAFSGDSAQAAIHYTHWCDGSDCAIEIPLTGARP